MSTQATGTEPIMRSVTVDCSVEHAFATFTERIDVWWPLATHSIEAYESGTAPQTVVFQGGAGGQLYERTSAGEELKWADVVAFDPPHRFVLAWNPSRERDRPTTEVEVTFTAEDGKTRVELQHRGWERLRDRAQESRESYGSGWDDVMRAFADEAAG